MRSVPVRPRLVAALCGALLASTPLPGLRAQAAEPMNEYTLGWENPATHLYDVSLTFSVEGQDSVDVHLPVWRPGRYIRQNYAGNVQEFAATDARGRALDFHKSGLSTWRIAAGEDRGSDPHRVTVRYRYYANTLDAGASLLGPAEAYFNPVNLFMYPEGQIFRPLRLTIEAPREWEIATALSRGDKANTFVAGDFHELADSPVIASPSLESLTFTLDEVPYTIWFQGRFEPGEYRDRIVPDVELIVRIQTSMFGGAPFDEYAFLFHLVPYPFGHAVEHANSSSYVIHDAAFASAQNYQGFLNIVAHELFHAWNVKRIRPAALWPYDYMQEQFTTLHWFTEGVTSYYAGLTLRRGAFTTPEEFLRHMGGVIDNLQRAPGRKVVPVALSSWDSWLTGYGQGNPNISVNFYGKGQILGFLLDARIRDLTDGERSLDDVFRHLYETWYEQGRGVPEDGVRLAAARVAGESLNEFFEDFVHGTEELPYDALLRPFGLSVRADADPARPEATLAIRTQPRGEHAVVASIDPDSPALAAGLDTGDQIVAVNGIAAPAQEWEALLAGVEPGEAVRLSVLRRDRLMELEVAAAGGGNERWVLERLDDTDERQERLFRQWIGDPGTPPED
ncbi:MAG: M61 family metallopeptidase [Gemmatimonadota bacterium]